MTSASAMFGGKIRVRAPAKINLHLSVGAARPDGYHELVTVFHAVDLVDELTVARAERHSVRTQPADGVPAGAKNLAGAAARLLARRSGGGGPVAIEITKNIPVAGGMAGGSADAAAALVGCAALWGLDIARGDLAQIAAELGSDVPFALTGGTAVGTGRGELLSPVLARTPLHWVLALAAEGLSTPAVFAELDRLRAAADPPRVGAGAGTCWPRWPAATPRPSPRRWATTCRPRRSRCSRGCGARCAPGSRPARWPGSSPAPARLSRCCAPTPSPPAASPSNWPGPGTCRAVRVATGPRPGRPHRRDALMANLVNLEAGHRRARHADGAGRSVRRGANR